MKKTLLTLALVLAAGGAQAIPLSGLLTGGSIIQGDKLFDSFTLLDYRASVDGRTFNPANIEVVGIGDGVTTDYGLQFTVNNDELFVTGDGDYAYADLKFGFRASVTDPGMAIVGSGMSLTGWQTVHAVDGINNLGMYIHEDVGTSAGDGDLAQMEVEHSFLDDVLIDQLSDSKAFGPQSELWVTKNIMVWSQDRNDTASLISFTQTFDQTAIPEPATLALFGLGLLGLGFARRRA